MSEENTVESSVISGEVESTEPTSTTQTTDLSSEDFNFRDYISEDLREDPSLTDIKDLGGLTKSYINAQRMLGNSIRIPGDDAGKEDLESFYEKLANVPGLTRIPDSNDEKGMNDLYTKMGRPEKPEEYDVSLTKGVPDPYNSVGEFKQIAHEAGLNKAQAQKLMDFYNKHVVGSERDYNVNQHNECMQQLKDKWGADYKSRLNGAKLAIKQYEESNPQAYHNLVNGPAGNNPLFIQALSDLAQNMSESDIIKGTSKVQYGITREEAQEKIDEIRRNFDHAFYNGSDPDHSAAVQKMQALYDAANPE